MTSKNLFLNLMKEDIRRRLFIPAISLVIFFFWFPVSTLISFVPQSIRFNDEPINKEELINGMIRAFNSLCNNRGLTFVLIVLFVIAAFTGFNFQFGILLAKNRPHFQNTVLIFYFFQFGKSFFHKETGFI